MFVLKLDPSSKAPVYQQIIDLIREAVESRNLRVGERLPSTRQLASILGVHRSTVAMAYQELWALGYLDLTQRTRPSVRSRAELASSGQAGEGSAVNWAALASTATNTLLSSHPSSAAASNGYDAGTIDLSALDMDPRLMPFDDFRLSFSRALKKYGSDVIGYGSPGGYWPLRQWVARRMQSHGISVLPEDILITNGSQHALDLVFRMMAEPGKRIVIESPTYDRILPLLRFHQLEPIEIPAGKEGMDLSLLEGALTKKHPALVYTMPSLHNPTGVSTSQAHREELLALCEKHGVPLLEDGFEEEMKYFGRAVLPVKSMDQRNSVIYCGTLSKVLSPGLRVGWVAAPRGCILRLLAIQYFTALASNLAVQAGIYEFCEEGHYDRHLGRMHRVFRRRMETAIDALEKHVSPEWAEWVAPNGGYLIWLSLARAQKPVDWNAIFRQHGVRVSLGDRFFYSPASHTHLRLSISRCDEEEIAEGIRRLGAALKSVYQEAL